MRAGCEINAGGWPRTGARSGAQPQPVIRAFRRAPEWAVRGQDPPPVNFATRSNEVPLVQEDVLASFQKGLDRIVPRCRDVARRHAGTACAGVQPHVLDRRTFRPVDAGVALIEAFRASDPTQFRWKDPPYEYEYEKMPIDCLAGSSALREQIEAGVSASDIAASWHDPVEAFLKTREHVLLY